MTHQNIKILAFAGSTRTGSFNKKLIRKDAKQQAAVERIVKTLVETVRKMS